MVAFRENAAGVANPHCIQLDTCGANLHEHGSQTYMSMELTELQKFTRGRHPTQQTKNQETIKDSSDYHIWPHLQSQTVQTYIPFTLVKAIQPLKENSGDLMANIKPTAFRLSPQTPSSITSPSINSLSGLNNPYEPKLFKQIIAQFEKLQSPTTLDPKHHSISLLVSLLGKSCFVIRPNPNIITNTASPNNDNITDSTPELNLFFPRVTKTLRPSNHHSITQPRTTPPFLK